jgi:hypothetical protein
VEGCHRQFLRGTDLSLCAFGTLYPGELRIEASARIQKSRRPASHPSPITSHVLGSPSSTSHESPVTDH